MVSVPFEQVGPLVQYSSRHKFLLVLVDYATRYPKTIPLRIMKAKTVTWELAQVFTQIGIPKQEVTNQGTSFMSEVLQDVWQFLGVQLLYTSVYHSQTNGLVQHFNGTLKRCSGSLLYFKEQ